MFIFEKQIFDNEQEIVLKRLAEAAARPGCRFLEVGSWCGDSTSIIGRVAKESGGTLCCVDWWKGNVGTPLLEAASQNDIFSVFWRRMREERLEDAVIPIRSRSDVMGTFLKEEIFDLVFIDADHTYEGLRRDIEIYARLLKPDGIICGHDCEGFLSDFDETLLEKGKDRDWYEGLHCGAILAVGRSFPSYGINHSIWSAKRNPTSGSWEPVAIDTEGICDAVQVRMPPLGGTKKYRCWRYKDRVYALPRSCGEIDIRDEHFRTHPDGISAGTIGELGEKLGEKIIGIPKLIGDYGAYEKYNLISFKDRIYAIHVGVGPFDLSTAEDEAIKRLVEAGSCIIVDSLKDAEERIAAVNHEFRERVINSPRFVGRFANHHTVSFRDKLYILSRSVGALDLKAASQETINQLIRDGKCLITDSEGYMSAQEIMEKRYLASRARNWKVALAQRIADYFYRKEEEKNAKKQR